MGYPSRRITIQEFSRANVIRCTAPDGFNHSLNSWSPSDWITAALGELGEAANKVKKLNRIRDNIKNKKGETIDELIDGIKQELCDTVIYIDLMLQAMGGDLERELVATFNKVSFEIGYPETMYTEY